MKKFVFLLAAVFLFQYFYNTKTVQISDIKHDNIILYAASWCGYCQNIRQFFDKNNIKYIEYDIEKSEKGRKQHEALKAEGVPVLDIKGTIIYGYDMKNTKYVLNALNLM